MKSKDGEGIRSEYAPESLGEGVRGEHYRAYQESRNLVLLSPDVAAAFPTEEAVNEALREVLANREKAGR